MKYLILLSPIILISCVNENSNYLEKEIQENSFTIYTQTSNLQNEYAGFSSVKAINAIANIENEYFNDYHSSASKYYGTIWKESNSFVWDEIQKTNTFQEYENSLAQKGICADSMHCTIYAMRALSAGLDSNFLSLEQRHHEIWNDREYAGWSIAYLLTKYYDWNAYLFISQYSEEYDICIKNYHQKKEYTVWKQPNIPLKGIFDFDLQKEEIDSLLSLNEFGWGFSYQGWHTWITRFETLKECNWAGSPSALFGGASLFLKTKFTNYYLYDSHIIVFPPKMEV